jgi:hypothetical protein
MDSFLGTRPIFTFLDGLGVMWLARIIFLSLLLYVIRVFSTGAGARNLFKLTCKMVPLKCGSDERSAAVETVIKLRYQVDPTSGGDPWDLENEPHKQCLFGLNLPILHQICRLLRPPIPSRCSLHAQSPISLSRMRRSTHFTALRKRQTILSWL